jgi:hypothetical protein
VLKVIFFGKCGLMALPPALVERMEISAKNSEISR